MENQTKTCPFCAEIIQAAAKKCRFCGEFLEKVPTTEDKQGESGCVSIAAKPEPVTTIQATAKQWKLGQLLGALMIIVSPVACASGVPEAGIPVCAMGIALYIFSRVAGWWHHG